MNGQEWVTLLTFAIGMVALSFISRQAALIVTGTVGIIIVLRHISPNGTGVGVSGNANRS